MAERNSGYVQLLSSLAMDTPEKNRSATASLSKFEDSPVFSFINSLSPIKPLKSIHIAQTFNSITFPSLPSIFRDPKSPTRTHHSDPAKSGPHFEDDTAVTHQSPGNLVPAVLPGGEDSELPENVKFDRYGESSDAVAEEFSEKVVVGDDGKRDGAAVGWESSISDEAELLIFSSSIISEAAELIRKPYQITGLSPSHEAHTNPIGDNPISNFHRGLRRRCLDFEAAATSETAAAAADDGSNSKLSSSSTRCTFPGIGLHLNALAPTLKDRSHSNSQNLSSEIQSGGPLRSPNSEKAIDTNKSEVHLNEDASQVNPKKNRQWMEFGLCKRCNCKKSRCLKLYCECFAAGVYCVEPCSCQECFNKPIHEDVVLETRRQIESRNPLAFAPKVIVNSDPVSEPARDDSNKTPASARHKRGCNCKKSSCLKKYCECYQGGVGCSDNCRCEGCKNAFGRKDESAAIGTETEQDEEESVEIRNDDAAQQNPCKSVIPLPFQLKRKLPSSFLESSRLSVRFKLENQSITQTHNTSCEEEMPKILCVDCSSGSESVKTVSPNSKRVILPPPPHRPSPATRIGRKLILQSVPSFPSLTPMITRVDGASKL